MKVAVIGVGAMGRNHARIYRDLPGAELVGVADANAGTAREVAARLGVAPYADYTELIERERPDAVTVAVPTAQHCSTVVRALELGCHVLVEKPLSVTLEEGATMVAAAEKGSRVLAVGHVERFNPALVELKRRLDAGDLGRVFEAHARRLGPFPARIRDVGVIIDLATHDIDVLLHLTGSWPARVYAETQRALNTDREDTLSGLLRFDNGLTGVLEINWLTPTKIRELSITGERGMFRVDYLTQDLFFFENSRGTATPWGMLEMLRGGVDEGAMTRFSIPKREPLRQELEAFLRAVAGDPLGAVTGHDGLRALSIALALIESGNSHQVVEPTPL